ncbi:DUF488 domain-containing protein [Tessaracoccus sp. OS52]|uniref:DUF488 domain-containing protein n=1 Tax=Tessaracoccus sp. OS52 TaxID=2886691 RepID=UPI001D0F5718|nr:DUF488 domain-containing protein [Tessaracoccus sp. OS52]MCC2592879.1 DUF488 domain-containing protein [Tessaracoccus sp. OS52]
MFTIGHSTHPLDEFVGLLRMHGVDHLVDIRTVPRSRTNPQYNLDALPESLAKHGIGHEYLKGLGGLRKVRADSVNTAWRNKSFQGYADHMASAEFGEALAELEHRTSEHTVAIMCAEAVWWRCHRSMVAEAMLVRGHDVSHIMPDGRLVPASLREFAVVEGARLTYPGPAGGDGTTP